MNRQLRRHPAAAKPAKAQPIRPTLRSSRPALSGRDGTGRNLLSVVRPAWAEDIISELRKVQWPTLPEAWNLTVVVIVVCIAFGISLGIIDYFYSWLVQNTLLR